MKYIWLAGLLVVATTASANSDLIIKLNPNASSERVRAFAASGTPLGGDWYQVSTKDMSPLKVQTLSADPSIAYVQPNYKLRLMHDYRVQDPKLRAQIQTMVNRNPTLLRAPKTDNPAFSTISIEKAGNDPLSQKQWGMSAIGVPAKTNANGMIVAVIDSGVDYNHEDLVQNIWRNSGEMGTDSQGRDRSTNGIDDDGNGYVDDVVGWDFVTNDNKPYDLTVSKWRMMLMGGNPGHGTHCAGNVGARSDNAVGIRGVAGNVKIMVLRFLSESGGGDTAGAVKAIRYAVDNGAKILSNSWGSEGEDPRNQESNEALKEAIRYANSKGVLFIAAAGNGHMGRGYDNDNDERPAYPASYDIENVISVAAVDANDGLGKFSNWGKKSVHLAAPGVNVYSTVVGPEKYNNFALYALFGLIKATWDGTSMATPHVAGAAAVYWAQNPKKSVQEVKAALLSSTKKLGILTDKVVSGGKLDVAELLKVK